MNTLPTYADRRRNFTQAATEVAGSTQGPHVSIKDNRFKLVDAAGNEKLLADRDANGRDCMDFIIANIHTQGKTNRVYYAGKFDPGAGDYKPPTCFSDNGVAPSSQASEPQSPTCASCQWAVWGSAVSESGVKKPACANKKKLAIIQPGGKMVFQFQVPPASLSNFSNYAKSVSGYTGADGSPMSVADVVTRVFFISQGVVDFAPVAQIDAADLAAVEVMWVNPGALEDVVGNRDQPWTGPIAVMGNPISTPQAQSMPSQVAPPPLPQAGQLTGGPIAQAIAQDVAAVKKSRGRPKKDEALPAAQGQPAQAPFMQQAPVQQAAPFMQSQPQPAPFGQMVSGQMVIPANGGGMGTPAQAAIDLPPFLQRQQANAQPAPAQGQQFGIVSNAAAPNADLQAALAAALNLPT